MEEKYVTYGVGALFLGAVGYLIYLKSKESSISTKDSNESDYQKQTTDITKQAPSGADVTKQASDILNQAKDILGKSSESTKNTDYKTDTSSVPPVNLGSVLGVQQALIANAYPVIPTGAYDDSTKQAVKNFQSSNGLSSDGVVGPKTREALAKGLSAKGIPYINDKSTVLIKGVHGKDPYHYSMYGWY